MHNNRSWTFLAPNAKSLPTSLVHYLYCKLFR